MNYFGWGILTLIGVLTFRFLFPGVKDPHRWKINYQFAQGLLFSQWLRLIIRHKGSLELMYFHRFLFVTIMSLVQSYWSRKERDVVEREEFQSIQIKNPVFIIGHYRTGTTLLHELIALDDRFVTPTTFQCFSPHSMISKEEEVLRKYGKISFRRPMDRMRISLNSPNEDEFALANLTMMSPYVGSVFIRDGNRYKKYLTFDEASPEEIDTWKSKLVFFYRKVLWKARDKIIALKSPAHTARLRLIHEVFPDAKFIHISRNPYDIYRSTMILYNQLITQWRLQVPSENYYRDAGLWQLQEMYRAYFRDRSALQFPKEQFIEISFEELEKNPVTIMETIYRQLNIDHFDRIKPKLQQWELEKHKNYKKNELKPLSKEELRLINENWAEYFHAFGYKIQSQI